ncbi:retrovirus-related pol polyprotein from transposon TNT 1-94 [Tanacetum coccineum]
MTKGGYKGGDKAFLVAKGCDRGACKLLGDDVIEVLGCLIEVLAGYGGAQNRVGNANPGQARQVKCYHCNGIGHIARNCTQPKRLHNSEYLKDKMLLMQAQENGVALDEEHLLFIIG